MAFSRLRIYHGPEDHEAATLAPQATAKPCVTVPLSEVLAQLADAVASQRAWLEDFEDDEITVSADLYDVLMAYRYYRPVA